jgi:hypothetical protein
MLIPKRLANKPCVLILEPTLERVLVQAQVPVLLRKHLLTRIPCTRRVFCRLIGVKSMTRH